MLATGVAQRQEVLCNSDGESSCGFAAQVASNLCHPNKDHPTPCSKHVPEFRESQMNLFVTNSATRRSFLRAGSFCVSVPFLETFARGKNNDAAPPKRMIFLGGGFGFTKETFYPKEAGRFSEIGLTEGLAPLKRHQDDFTMIANLSNPSAARR